VLKQFIVAEFETNTDTDTLTILKTTLVPPIVILLIKNVSTRGLTTKLLPWQRPRSISGIQWFCL
jgi:hypothetical protein